MLHGSLFQRSRANAKGSSYLREAVDFRNEMIQRANHPADKQNKSLVKKHYAQMRRDMMTRIDALFGKLSDICK